MHRLISLPLKQLFFALYAREGRIKCYFNMTLSNVLVLSVAYTIIKLQCFNNIIWCKMKDLLDNPPFQRVTFYMSHVEKM